MPKESKITTPDWIREGYDSPAEYAKAKGKKVEGKKPKEKEVVEKKAKGKTFKIKVCPKCGNNEVEIVLKGEEGKKADEWHCKKCGWKGKDIKEKELTEDEMLDLLDRMEGK